VAVSDLERLAALSYEVLPHMVDARTGLFAHKTFRNESGYVNVGNNPLYTAMVLVGLASESPSIPDWAKRAVDPLIARAARSGEATLLGTTVWALASLGDERAVEATAQLGARLDVRREESMGLGLALAGAAAAASAGAVARGVAGAIADACRRALLERVSRSGYFRGMASLRVRRRPTAGRFGSFASQVYPLLGLALGSAALEFDLPEAAPRIAAQLVESQGPLGQWWWFYSTSTGRVLQGYPVYSVHQDAMAFMALLPLEELGYGSYSEPLSRGLDWLMGKNELGIPLVDFEPGFISRCIQRRDSDPDAFGGMSRGMRRRLILSSLGLAREAGTRFEQAGLGVLGECRPYHLGWIVLAEALLRRGRARPAVIKAIPGTSR
jgi:hypothetical protein